MSTSSPSVCFSTVRWLLPHAFLRNWHPVARFVRMWFGDWILIRNLTANVLGAAIFYRQLVMCGLIVH
ncbi:MAG: hypothetical protein AAF754_14355 [Pseudomonadota bacterium]